MALIEKFDMEKAGIGVSNATEAAMADEFQIVNHLKVLYFAIDEYVDLLTDCLNKGDQEGAKIVKEIILRREKQMSTGQSLLSYFRAVNK